MIITISNGGYINVWECFGVCVCVCMCILFAFVTFHWTQFVIHFLGAGFFPAFVSFFSHLAYLYYFVHVYIFEEYEMERERDRETDGKGKNSSFPLLLPLQLFIPPPLPSLQLLTEFVL